MIRGIACFVADCDDCHTTYDDDGQGFNVHFDSDRQALDHLAADGWTVTEDGHIRCPVCTARDFCASLNHLWDICASATAAEPSPPTTRTAAAWSAPAPNAALSTSPPSRTFRPPASTTAAVVDGDSHP
jgi:hypothetical protein